MEKATRRDFLKIASLLPPAFLFPPSQDQSSVDSPKINTTPEILSLINGSILLVPENHLGTIEHSQLFEDIGFEPEIHFLETMSGIPASEFQKNSMPSEMLFWNYTSPDGKLFYGPQLTAQTLVSFAKTGVSVAFEGIKYLSVDIFDQIETFGFLSKDRVRVDLRNILIARKLQFLLSSGRNRISVSIGNDHFEGIKQILLKEGGHEVFNLLNEYPRSFLKKIISENGGPDSLSSTIIISASGVLIEKTEAKEIIQDDVLCDYLSSKMLI